tara:strand:+ start:1606 stop:1782 length:177 start_codon:yes stop_codon:yes gene_type:complete
MDLLKDTKRHSGKHTLVVDSKTHKKIKDLAYQNKTNNKEIVKKAIDLYQKVTIFDNLS